MRKFFTFCIVFLAMTICAKAQAPVFSENFDSGMPTGWTQIDANNDGMGWEHSSNPASYFVAGTDLSGTGHNSSTGFVVSGSFSNVTGSAITPDNWLITPAITLTANSTLSFWICGQDASYAAEHYGVYISTTNATSTSAFTMLNQWTIGSSKVQTAWEEKTVDLSAYTGQTVYIAFRHFNCNDQFVLDLDDVTITAQPTSPTIVANPITLDFGTTSLGTTVDATVAVTTFNLTAGVTATTAAPFSVSADGTTYGTTATLATAGGTLYVQYAPTTAGTDNGTVTLASTGATNVTVSLTGSAIDCSNITIPFTEGFEGGIDCWTMISADPANNDRFGIYADANAYDGNFDFRFSSFSTASDYNQYLITPQLTLPAGQTYTLKFYYKGYNANENFKVLYSTTDNNLSSFTMLSDFTNVATSWTLVALDLPAGTKYVAINYYGNYQYYLYVDNINIAPLSAPDVFISGPTELEVGSTGTFSATSPLANSFAWVVDGVAATSTTNTLTYSFTTAGIHNVKVIATNNVGSNADSMDVDVYVCNAITQFPYTEGFENSFRCWTMISMDPANDGNFGVLNNASYANEGTHAFMFSSYSSASDYNQYLITPELQFPAGSSYSFGFYYMGWSADDNFKVLYSTTDNNPSSFTVLADYTNVATEWTQTAVALPAGTKYVAINYYGDYSYYLFVDNINIAQLAAPTVTIQGPGAIEVGNPAVFTAVNQLAESFAWTVDGSAVSSTTNTLTHTFTTTGNHTVGVTATNSVGSATASFTINVFSCDQAQTLPYFDGFEGGMGCWTPFDEDGDGYTWVDNINSDWPYQAYDGNGCIMSASFINNVGALEPDNWVVSPAIVIPNEGAKLSFFVAAQDASYADEHYGVYVSTSGTNPSNFTLLFEEDLDANGGPRDQGAWKQKFVNLNYGGQTVYVAFRHFNVTDMFWMLIDNVSVTPGVGVDNHELNAKIYPNPANNVLNVNANSNINKVEVYNMLGQNVMTVDVNDTNASINTSNLSTGMYTLKLHTDNGVVNRKFTVAR